eukprot:scaffold1645_cov288-Pavlova_lutheri.AAC.2
MSFVFALPREVELAPPAFVERDEQVCAEVSVLERQFGGFHLFLRGHHFVRGVGHDGSHTDPSRPGFPWSGIPGIDPFLSSG